MFELSIHLYGIRLATVFVRAELSHLLCVQEIEREEVSERKKRKGDT